MTDEEKYERYERYKRMFACGIITSREYALYIYGLDNEEEK